MALLVSIDVFRDNNICQTVFTIITASAQCKGEKIFVLTSDKIGPPSQLCKHDNNQAHRKRPYRWLDRTQICPDDRCGGELIGKIHGPNSVPCTNV